MDTYCLCGLFDFLKRVDAYTCVCVEMDVYPDDVYYYVSDGTVEQARYVSRLMLKKYKHPLVVIGISTNVNKLHNAVLKVHCK